MEFPHFLMEFIFLIENVALRHNSFDQSISILLEVTFLESIVYNEELVEPILTMTLGFVFLYILDFYFLYFEGQFICIPYFIQIF